MNRIHSLGTPVLLAGIILSGLPEAAASTPIESGMDRPASVQSLAGKWSVRLDPDDVGIGGGWWKTSFPDWISLPGSLTEQNYGEEISVSTRWTGTIIDSSWFTDAKYTRYREAGNIKLPFWLTPRKHYVGAAWYQRNFVVPAGWKGKRTELFLERTHWETQVWLDGRPLGMQNSLCVPHEYELGTLTPGSHRLVVRVDNRQKIWVGSDAHSICDHTQTNWNGLIGRIELRAHDLVRIEGLSVFPDCARKSVRIATVVDNASTAPVSADLFFSALPVGGAPSTSPPQAKIRAMVPPGRSTVDVSLSMGDTVRLWDEFSPNLYRLEAGISAGLGGRTHADYATTSFGMREFRTRGTNFVMNGNVVFLRGTLEACVFPLTGYPPMELPEWERVFRVAKDHGLNHIRFHSWCPPEAAFVAADGLGLILHVETPVWTRLGQDSTIDAFVYQEGDLILKTYGNHPSFCMLAVGNEPAGEHQKEFLSKIVPYWKNKDPRHLYTTASGWPILPVSDYNSTPDPRAHAWGAGLTSRFNAQPLTTETDYTGFVSQFSVPTVSHEIGQWCAYPDLKETSQYTGVLQAENFEIVREDLRRKNMLDQADRFLLASGRLQVIEYKEEIETALRTKGFGGFQLLGLHDFPGQGTALVGVLNPFWRSKGYLQPEEFRRFCSATVPLLRANKFVWTNGEEFRAEAEFANYSASDITDAIIEWAMTREDGGTVASGRFDQRTLRQGDLSRLGTISAPLHRVTRASQLTLTLSLKGTACVNSWKLWVYPAQLPPARPGELVVAEELTPQVEEALQRGMKVLLLASPKDIASTVPPGFSSIFWNTAWTGKQPPHTLGILCDPGHRLFAEFPTDLFTNWQWWEIVSASRSMNLDSLPSGLRPVVQVIDDWNTNRKLGLVFEARVGKGSLLVSSVDFKRDMDKRPVARQLLYALTSYAASEAFTPGENVEVSDLRSIFIPRGGE